jgi:hypothetical protein
MWDEEMYFLAGVLTGIIINVIFIWVKGTREVRGVDQEFFMENQEEEENAGECEWDRLEREFKEEGERMEREARERREEEEEEKEKAACEFNWKEFREREKEYKEREKEKLENKTCFKCYNKGHLASNCKGRVKCLRCGGRGHVARDCKTK